MKVIFNDQLAGQLDEQYIVLELDTFRQEGLEQDITAYAIIDSESLKLDEFPQIENMKTLHNTMMLEYKRKNFSFCEQALEHLRGKWSGELDSFYDEFDKRIQLYKGKDLPEDWEPVVVSNISN